MADFIRGDASYQWTAREIRARLGCSTGLFPRDRLLEAEDVAKMAQLGITYMEINPNGRPGHLDFNNRAHISEVVAECERQGVSIVAMHSPVYKYGSEDEEVRKKAVDDGVVAAKVAEDMGAKVMVLHVTTDDLGEQSVTEMLDQLDGHSIKLGIENLDKPLEDYAALVDKLDSERVGMVVDIGHTMDDDGVNPFTKKERARENMVQCGKRLISVHLHDWVDGDHVSPLDGSIEWAEVFAALKDIDYQGVLMFEALFPPDKKEISPDYVLGKVGSFPEAFVDRYVK